MTENERPRIADLAFLSDCRSTAIVSPAGSVDWWCVPRLDSPSVFGRLLDGDAGHWTLAPVGDHRAQRHYEPDTLVLVTRYETATGVAEVRDALVFEAGARAHDVGLASPAVLVRRIDGVAGTVEFGSEFAPRPEYGLTLPRLRTSGDASDVVASGGPVTLRLRSSARFDLGQHAATTTFTVAAGGREQMLLAYESSYGRTSAIEHLASDPVADTTRGWQSWTRSHPGVPGPYEDLVRHSSVVLQGLTYGRSGAVVAAGTTSLPEQFGAGTTWDYRYVWLRDLSFTVRALYEAACPDEADRFFVWIARALGRPDGGPVPVVCGVEGERDLSERELPHLAGFAGEGPVRVGNGAWRQRQNDIAGEVLDAAWRLRDRITFDDETVELLSGLAERARADWNRPDSGMWEARDRQRPYLSSIVFCWHALDRAIALAPRLGGAARVGEWTATRDEIRDVMLTQGWNEDVGAYTGALGSSELDASVLVMPLIGFLPATDERMLATIRVIEKSLGGDGTVHRWKDEAGGFVMCAFWLSECLVLAGETGRAREWFERTVAFAGELGLLAEQVDPDTGVQLGNYPQAFSHVALINAAWRLSR